MTSLKSSMLLLSLLYLSAACGPYGDDVAQPDGAAMCQAGDCLMPTKAIGQQQQSACLNITKNNTTTMHTLYEPVRCVGDDKALLRELQKQGYALSPICDAADVAGYCYPLDQAACDRAAMHCFGWDEAAALCRHEAAGGLPAHYYFLLDRSGSMGHLRDDVVGGINSYIEGRAANLGEGDVTLVTLIQFDSNEPHQVTFAGEPVDTARRLTRADYVPRGSTPLYDAIGQIIGRAAGSLRDERQVVIVFTDGQENASVEHTKQSVRKLIEAKKREGWAFVFMGANIDAFAEGGQVGIGRQATQNYHPDTAGVGAAFASLKKASTRYERTSKASYTRTIQSGGSSAGDELETMQAASANFFEGSNIAQEDFENRGSTPRRPPARSRPARFQHIHTL